MDLKAAADVVLPPGETRLVPTGLALKIPPGYEAQIRPRSGLALKHSITMPNAPATIDPGYRGELQVILLNLGREPYTIRTGDRIAQMIISRLSAWNGRKAILRNLSAAAADSGLQGLDPQPMGEDQPSNRRKVWWTAGGSNPRPPHCERGALPTELAAHLSNHFIIQRCLSTDQDKMETGS